MDPGREVLYYIQRRPLKKVYEPLIYVNVKSHSFRHIPAASCVCMLQGLCVSKT